MVEIKKIERADSDTIERIAAIHMDGFPAFFLTKLGKRFIKLLYRCYIDDNESGIIVAKDDEGIVGFIAYSNDYPAFYKKLIKRHLIQFAAYSLEASIKHPSFVKRLLGAFRKSEDVKKNEKYVEIASICVDPKKASRGTGTMLMEYIKEDVNFSEYEYINLETDAGNNDRVNNFYKKNGFRLERTYTTREGRKMNEYRYKRGQK